MRTTLVQGDSDCRQSDHFHAETGRFSHYQVKNQIFKRLSLLVGACEAPLSHHHCQFLQIHTSKRKPDFHLHPSFPASGQVQDFCQL